MADNAIAITAAGLTKNFGHFTAVQDLSLNVKRGEIYALLGLNGAGKTTTIRMLLGMIRPSAGRVALLGKEVSSRQDARAIWERVGYMVEAPHAYPDLTVKENLEGFRRLRGLKTKEAVENIIQKLGLQRDADRRARTLSLGNAQRLGLAKALMHNPDLLVLDEPSNGLDPAGIVEIRNLLHDLAFKEGVTIFISSHILSEVTRLAGRIGIVHKGRLIKELDPNRLAAEEGTFLRINVRNKTAALTALQQAGLSVKDADNDSLIVTNARALAHPEEIATLLVQSGSPPYKLLVEKRDLESYFLSLVNGAGKPAEEKDNEQNN